MPIATNPDTGEVNYYNGTDWVPAKTAVKPDTKEMMAFDGKDWVHVTSHGPGISQHVEESTRAIGMGWGQVVKEAITNVPSSAAEFAKNVAQPFIHPIDTAENLGSIGKGILQKVGMVGGTESEKYADAVGKFFMDRYGSMDAIKKTIAEDPVGVAADVATLLTGGGAAVAKAPGLVGKVGEAVSAAGRAVDPLSAVGGLAKGAGKVASEVAGITTGAGSDAIKIAAQAGAKGGDAGKAFLDNLRGAADPNAVVQDAKKAVGAIRQERGKVYREEMAKIRADNTVLDFDKIDQAVEKVAAVKTYKGQSLSPKTAGIRQELTEAVSEWKVLDPKEFHTAEGLDALKQKIGDIRDATEAGSPDRLVANEVYNSVKGTIVDQAPEYAKVMKGYEEASSLIKEMEKTLSLNPKATVDTQLRKLQSVLRNNVSTNYGRRTELVEFLQNAGAPHLMEKLAGQSLSALAPRGLGRILAGGEGVSALSALLSGNPKVAAGLGVGMAASSPALAGATAFGLGSATRLPLRRIGQSAFQAGRIQK